MAIPFVIGEEQIRASPILQLMQFERLLKDMLNLLTWSGWNALPDGGALPIDQQQVRVRRPPNAAQQRQMPDLVASCPLAPAGADNAEVEAAAAAAAAVELAPQNSYIARERALYVARQAALDRYMDAHLYGSGAPEPAAGAPEPAAGAAEPAAAAAAGAVELAAAGARAITVQMQFCADCYYHGDDRKLKVIGVTRIEKTGAPLAIAAANHHHHHNHVVPVLEDEDDLIQQLQVACRNLAQQQLENRHDLPDLLQTRETAGYGSKVAKHLSRTFLNRSTIESSILTAVFVVVGMKMFVKH